MHARFVHSKYADQVSFYFIHPCFLGPSCRHRPDRQRPCERVQQSNGGECLHNSSSGWAAAPAGAGWISCANTGMGSSAVAPPNSPSDPILREQFLLPGTVNTGSVRVWADDTPSVQLEGVQVGLSAIIQLDSACAAEPIGCEPLEFVDISLDRLSQGAHVLSFSVY